MIRLDRLTPAAEQGWGVLFDLAEVDEDSLLLIGGQMMQLLAAEHDVGEMVLPTDDVDVVVDVRAWPGGTRWLAEWLTEQGFAFEGADRQGVGHRFVRDVIEGPGRIIVDVLAPEGLGDRTDITTIPPARTVQVPGSVQALNRSEIVEVTVSDMTGRTERTGRVRRPTLLGALIAKAAATTIAVRDNPDRDWQDAALLLTVIPDPTELAGECTPGDRRRLRLLQPMEDREHIGWAAFDDEAHRRGTSALSFLIEV